MIAILGIAMVASAVLLAYVGRGQTFGGDEMGYASRLSEHSLLHVILYPPPNKYLIAPALVVFRVFLGVFGFDSETPFRALAIALVLLCSGLFFLLARRRVGDLLALPPSILLLFFGYGGEEVLTGERIPELMTFAAGLGILLVLPERTRRSDVVAAVLLTVAVTSHPAGLSFAAAAAVLILLCPSPERWRRAWVVLVPVGLFAVWWLFLRPAGTVPVQKNLGELASFVGQSWTAAVAAISGLAGVLDGSAYHHALGWLVAALVFALAGAGVATHWRKLPPSFWAAVVALATLWVITGLTRGNGFLEVLRPADSARYLYPAAILVLLVLVELAGTVRLPAWGAWAATGVLALGLAANLHQLRDVGVEQRLIASQVQTRFGAIEIPSRVPNQSYRPYGVFYPTAGEYLDAVRAFGSPGFTPAQIAARPEATRLLADTTLVQAMGLSARPAPKASGSGKGSPRVERTFQGSSSTAAGCLTLRATQGAGAGTTQPPALPSPPSTGSTAAPALAEVTLPPGGVSIAAARIADVGLRIGRFADTPSVPLKSPAAGRTAALAIPRDGVALPWKLIVYSREPVSLCGLGAAP